MVERTTGDRQAVALDRVRKENRRALGLGVRQLERVEDVGEIVAAEILDQRANPAPVLGEQALESQALVGSEIAQKRLDDDLLGGAEEALVELVRHLVDAPPEKLAAVSRVGLPPTP